MAYVLTHLEENRRQQYSMAINRRLLVFFWSATSVPSNSTGDTGSRQVPYKKRLMKDFKDKSNVLPVSLHFISDRMRCGRTPSGPT